MNLDNRRLRELQQEIKLYYSLLNSAEKEEDKLIYKGKLESLEREEDKILKRNNAK